MNLAQNIITNINEKASIDWNNYLTPEEVDKFLSKDDKVESAEEIIYDTKGNFYQKYFDEFKNSGWTKRELTKDLSEFFYNGNLNESGMEAVETGPYKAGDGTWVIDLKPGYSTQYGTNYIQCKTRKECLAELEDISKDTITENAKDLWKSQIDTKSEQELEAYLKRLLNQLYHYNDNSKELKSDKFYQLLDKIEYLESKLGIKTDLGFKLH